MKKNLKLLIIILFLSSIFLSRTVLSQETVLPPATTYFVVNPIFLIPDAEGNVLRLTGDLDYLTIEWDVYYIGENGEITEGTIGVECYLNCPDSNKIWSGEELPNITKSCEAYQKCTYLGDTGEYGCSILNPNYLFNTTNNVTCNFYDPGSPDIPSLDENGNYLNRNFWPINFDVYAVDLSVPLGEAFNPVRIKNLGLLTSNYIINITTAPYDYADNVYIENSVSSTDSTPYGHIAEPNTSQTITIRVTGSYHFKILVKSNIEPTNPMFDISCSGSKPCPSFFGDVECIPDRCWKKMDITISSGLASLPEFGWFGLVQIILLAAVVLFIKFKFYNKS